MDPTNIKKFNNKPDISSRIIDINRKFNEDNSDIIKCEPYGMRLIDLEFNKVIRMRIID